MNFSHWFIKILIIWRWMMLALRCESLRRYMLVFINLLVSRLLPCSCKAPFLECALSLAHKVWINYFTLYLSSMKTINQSQLLEKSKQAKTLVVDARTSAEYRLEHITGAVNLPIDQFPDHITTLKQYDNVVVYCNSWGTSSQFVKKAQQAWIEHCYNLIGWISSCQPSSITKIKWPLPITRQVHLAAGLLVLAWAILSLIFNQWLIAISAFVWAGLTFAGLSGRCGMAKLLVMMPWNQDHSTPVQHHTIKGKDLIIRQFEDKKLAHYSYVAISNGDAIVVDPERNPQKYYDFIDSHHATLVWIYNTHPHADFASGHLQMHLDTGATIYVWDKVGAEYPHTAVVGGEKIMFGAASVTVQFTPGHSPDSMSYLIQDSDNKQVWLCTGDWVFIGDVGRADLRESVGNIKAAQAQLAAQMYDTTRELLPTLDQSLMLLPAHGAGTSCGKWLSKQPMDTLANQMKYNPMLQDMSKEAFVAELSSDQPSIPAYFTHSVLLNKTGNSSVTQAREVITMLENLPSDTTILDTRTRQQATNYPVSQTSINLPHQNNNFVWMLGAIIMPKQSFILVVEKHADLNPALHDIMSIGYEYMITGVYVIEDHGAHEHIIHHKDLDTCDVVILDVRAASTVSSNPFAAWAVNIPIEQLAGAIDTLDKSVTYVPYCGWSYKSDIAISLLRAHGYQSAKMYV